MFSGRLCHTHCVTSLKVPLLCQGVIKSQFVERSVEVLCRNVSITSAVQIPDLLFVCLLLLFVFLCFCLIGCLFFCLFGFVVSLFLCWFFFGGWVFFFFFFFLGGLGGRLVWGFFFFFFFFLGGGAEGAKTTLTSAPRQLYQMSWYVPSCLLESRPT